MVEIRPANAEDAQRLFEWRNDTLTRAMSRSPDPVEWSGHIKWLTDRLSKPEPNLFIATGDGIPVGTFRIDGNEISYTIAPHSRGKGFGHAMLCKAREMFGPKIAEIYDRNVASIKVAERAGMSINILATPEIPRSEGSHPHHHILTR